MKIAPGETRGMREPRMPPPSRRDGMKKKYRRGLRRRTPRSQDLSLRLESSTALNALCIMFAVESRRPYRTAGHFFGHPFPGFYPGLFSFAPFGSGCVGGVRFVVSQVSEARPRAPSFVLFGLLS